MAQPDGSIKTEYVPMNPARPFTGGNGNFNTYCKGNYYDNNKDGALDGVEITETNWSQYCSGSPVFLKLVLIYIQLYAVRKVHRKLMNG